MNDEIRNLSDLDETELRIDKDFACYCPKCKRMSYGQFNLLQKRWILQAIKNDVEGYLDNHKLNVFIKETYSGDSLVYVHTCRQCHNETFLIKHTVDGEPTLTFVYSTVLQYDTSCVPEGINYYMGQAFKSKSVGAYSAAMAMYRSALEFLLYESGFDENRLVDKIKSFEDKPPDWATSLSSQFMGIIRELGNDSVHPNRGNISEQEKFDFDMLEAVEITLNELIERAYIFPQKEKDRLSVLSKASRKVN